MRNKFLTKILGVTLGLAMAIGVGVGVARFNSKDAVPVHADEGSLTVTAANLGYTNTTYSNKSGVAYGSEGFKFSTTDVCKESGKTNFQLKKSSGALWNSTCPSGYTISTIELTNKSGGTVSVYKGASASPSTAASGTNNVYTINNSYFKISGPSAAAYFTLVINYDDGQSSFGTLDHIKVSTQPNIKTFAVGDTFSSSGLQLTGYDAANEASANTQVYSSGYTTDLDSHGPFVQGDIGNKTVTVTYSGKTTTYTIKVIAARDFIIDGGTNKPANITSSTNTSVGEGQVGGSGVKYGYYALQTYSSNLEFNKATDGAYIGNNESYGKYIKYVRVSLTADHFDKLTMYKGDTAIPGTTAVSTADAGLVRVFEFGDDSEYFALKQTTMNTWIQVTKIEVFLGSTVVPAEVNEVIASIKSGTYVTGSTLSASDFNVTVTWTGGKADTHPTEGFTWTVNGAVNGTLNEGDNNVYVTYQGVDSASFVVEGTTIHAESVNITEENADVAAGDTVELNASITPANAVDTICWSSSNESVATVNNSGVVTGVAPGSATITASANGHSDTCDVAVFERIDFTDKSYNVKKPAAAQSEASTALVGKYTINLLNSYNDNNGGTTYAYLMFGSKDLSTGNTLVSNKTPAPAPITKVVFKIRTGSAGDAVYKASLASSEVSEVVTSETHKRTGAGTLEITADAQSNMRYFAISSTNSSKNGQLEYIDVYYEKPTAKVAINNIKTRSTLAYKYTTNPSLSFTGVAMRFGGLVSKTLWNELDAQNGGSNIEGYGILLSTPEYLKSAKLETKYETFDGTNVKKFDHAVATLPDDANVAQKNGLLEACYVWNLFKDVTVNPAAEFTSVAYIRTKTEVVFFDETTKSAKQLAIELLATDDYDDDSLDGSMYSLAHWGE